MSLNKVDCLNLGDCIAIVSPSNHLNDIFPHRLVNAINFLESLGFDVVVKPETVDQRGNRPAFLKAQELHDCFSDDKIRGIICSTGGLSANELLNCLDYNLIRSNPKFFCGYSDITILHAAITTQCKFETYYGPAALTQFAEQTPEIKNYMEHYFRRAAMSDEAIGVIKPSAVWTDEFLDWRFQLDLTRGRQTISNKGHVWIQSGLSYGELIGGCLYSLLQIKGTAFDFDYSGKILFIDIPEGYSQNTPTPLAFVRSQLVDLDLAGTLSQLSGVIVGRPIFYSEQDNNAFLAMLGDVFQSYDYPVLANVNIGHVDPILTIPYGRNCHLNSATEVWEIT